MHTPGKPLVTWQTASAPSALPISTSWNRSAANWEQYSPDAQMAPLIRKKFEGALILNGGYR